jgi:excinuclease ABC subunit C
LDLSIPVVGLAKRNEELFLPHRSDPVMLPEAAPPLRILQHVRDESHRFATTYRAGLQKQDIITPIVRKVPGIGPKRANRIMRSFPQVESLLETPVDIIAKSTGISEEQAAALQDRIRKDIYQ